jgi:serine acetyltransferase
MNINIKADDESYNREILINTVTTDILNWVIHYNEWLITKEQLDEWITRTILNTTNSLNWYEITAESSFKGTTIEHNQRLVLSESMKILLNQNPMNTKDIIEKIIAYIDKIIWKK